MRPEGEDATLRREVVAPLWHARTVEGDLGMRWNADGVVDAAEREGLTLGPELRPYARAVAAQPGRLPASPREQALDLELARLAAVLAARRHGRPATGESPRPLGAVGLVLGSGGVLRHNGREAALEVLRAVAADHAGGWRVPRSAAYAVDADYLLFAVGLLADIRPQAAQRLAHTLAE